MSQADPNTKLDMGKAVATGFLSEAGMGAAGHGLTYAKGRFKQNKPVDLLNPKETSSTIDDAELDSIVAPEATGVAPVQQTTMPPKAAAPVVAPAPTEGGVTLPSQEEQAAVAARQQEEMETVKAQALARQSAISTFGATPYVDDKGTHLGVIVAGIPVVNPTGNHSVIDKAVDAVIERQSKWLNKNNVPEAEKPFVADVVKNAAKASIAAGVPESPGTVKQATVFKRLEELNLHVGYVDPESIVAILKHLIPLEKSQQKIDFYKAFLAQYEPAGETKGDQNAVQERSTTQEVPSAGTTREAVVEDSAGVGREVQGAQVAGEARTKKESVVNAAVPKTEVAPGDVFDENGRIVKALTVAGAKQAIQEANSDLGAWITQNIPGASTAKFTPEQEQSLMPILVKYFDAAYVLGKQSFKDALEHVREILLGQGFKPEQVDEISGATLKSAYAVAAKQNNMKAARGTKGAGAVSENTLDDVSEAMKPLVMDYMGWDENGDVDPEADPMTLKDLSRKYGLTPEGHRKQLAAMGFNEAYRQAQIDAQTAEQATEEAAPDQRVEEGTDEIQGSFTQTGELIKDDEVVEREVSEAGVKKQAGSTETGLRWKSMRDEDSETGWKPLKKWSEPNLAQASLAFLEDGETSGVTPTLFAEINAEMYRRVKPALEMARLEDLKAARKEAKLARTPSEKARVMADIARLSVPVTDKTYRSNMAERTAAAEALKEKQSPAALEAQAVEIEKQLPRQDVAIAGRMWRLLTGTDFSSLTAVQRVDYARRVMDIQDARNTQDFDLFLENTHNAFLQTNNMEVTHAQSKTEIPRSRTDETDGQALEGSESAGTAREGARTPAEEQVIGAGKAEGVKVEKRKTRTIGPKFSEVKTEVPLKKLGARLYQIMSEVLDRNPAILRSKPSKATTVEGAIKDVFPGSTLLGYMPDQRSEQTNKTVGIKAKRWDYLSPEMFEALRNPDNSIKRDKDGKPITKSMGKFEYSIYEDDDGRVWISVPKSVPGGGGQYIYSAVGDYAFNTKQIFKGDPDGGSEDSLIRRTTNMLNNALRHGTTKHLSPLTNQQVGDNEKGVPPLRWVKGYDVDNLQSLVDTLIATVDNNFPDFKEMRYDFSTDTFYNVATGRTYNSVEFERLSGHRGARAAKAGEGTLREVAMLKSIAEGASGINVEKSGLASILDGKTLSLVSMMSEPGSIANPVSASTLTNNLKKLFRVDAAFDKLVTVYATQKEAITAGILSESDGRVAGFKTPDGKIGMIAENIESGKELGVFLHEVGVHLGMEKLIGAANMKWLDDKIQVWAKRNDGSKESVAAKAAIDRSKQSTTDDNIEGRIAYMTEELVNAGITPNEVSNSEGHIWFRRLWAAAKASLRKLQFKHENFSGQNLVDLAYGAANMELEGAWHGTAAEFRNFRHDYMGSGEGAQAFGWGTYLAQRVGIAKGYLKADVERKTREYANFEVFFDGVVVNASDPAKDSRSARLDKDSRSARNIALEEISITGVENTLAWAVELSNTHSAVWQSKKLGREVAAWINENRARISVEPISKPKGSLMRVAANVREDEFLDWDKPLSEQSEKVKAALEKVRIELETAGFLDDYLDAANAEWGELTGEELYKRILNKAHEDGVVAVTDFDRGDFSDYKEAASKYLDSIGIKGIKFLDARSRGRGTEETTVNGVHYRFVPKGSGMPGGNIVDMATGEVIFDSESTAEVKREFEKKYGKSAWSAVGEQKTSNLVIFNDKNIVRVKTQVGGSRADEDIKFSEETAPRRFKTWDTFQNALPHIERTHDVVAMHKRADGSWDITTKKRDATKPTRQGELKLSQVSRVAENIGGETMKQSVVNAKHYTKMALDSLESLPDMVDRVKKVLPSAVEWYTNLMDMKRTRVKLERKADAVVSLAEKLSIEEYKRVNAFIAMATTEQKWYRQPKWLNRTVVVDPIAKAEWDKLSRDEKIVVDSVFKFGEDEHESLTALFKKMGIDDVFTQIGKLDGPYAPLKRFGTFIGLLKSKTLLAAERDVKAGGGVSAEKTLEKLKKDSSHYVIRKFYTRGQAQVFADKNKSKFASTEAFAESERTEDTSSMGYKQLQRIMAAVETNMDGLPSDAQDSIKKLVKDIYMSTVDQTSARQSGQKRLGVAGYDENMMRAFATHARAHAAFVATVTHGADVSKSFYEMREEANENHHAGVDDFNMLARHYAAMTKYDPSPVSDAVTTGVTVWMLSTNIAYHFQNFTQAVVKSLPKLAADFGGGNYMNAWGHLIDGYKLMSEISEYGMHPDLEKIEDPGLRAALINAAELNMIDVGIEEDLKHLGRAQTGYTMIDGSSALVGSALHKLRQVSRTVESWNRVSSAAAAYTMAIKHGRTQSQAQAYVMDMLNTTQGDVSRASAPLLLKKIPRVTAQFKRFQFMTAAMYSKAFYKAFAGASKEEKAVGRRMLGYMLAHTAVAGGLLALPMMNVASLIFGGVGDDEPEDMDTVIRRNFGKGPLADLILDGAPKALFGIDMSAKLSDRNVFSISPYTDFDVTSAAGIAKTAAGLVGGAAMSQAGRMASGIGYMEQGDLYKGVEKMVPKGVEQALQTFRLANEGVTLRNGDVIIKPEDLDAYALALNAVGMPSAQIREITRNQNVQYDVRQYYKKRTQHLTQQYVKASRARDPVEMSAIVTDWIKMQSSKDKVRYLFNNEPDELKKRPASSLRDSVKSANERQRQEQRVAAQ